MLIPKFQAINFSSIKNINNVKINNFFYNPINFKGSLDKDTVELSSSKVDRATLAQEQKEAIESLKAQNAAYVKRTIDGYKKDIAFYSEELKSLEPDSDQYNRTKEAIIPIIQRNLEKMQAIAHEGRLAPKYVKKFNFVNGYPEFAFLFNSKYTLREKKQMVHERGLGTGDVCNSETATSVSKRFYLANAVEVSCGETILRLVPEKIKQQGKQFETADIQKYFLAFQLKEKGITKENIPCIPEVKKIEITKEKGETVFAYDLSADSAQQFLDDLKNGKIAIKSSKSRSFLYQPKAYQTSDNGTFVSVDYIDMENEFNKKLEESSSTYRRALEGLPFEMSEAVSKEGRKVMYVDYSNPKNAELFNSIRDCTVPKSKYFGEADEERMIPSTNLKKAGYGNVATLTRLVKEGKLDGEIKTINGKDVAIVCFNADSYKILSAIREKMPNITRAKDLAKDLGISQKRITEMIMDGTIDTVDEAIVPYDIAADFIDTSKEKNKEAIEKIKLEQELKAEILNKKREYRKQQRIEVKDAAQRMNGARMAIVWSFMPETKAIASTLAKNDGYIAKLLAKEDDENVELTQREKIALNSYRKQVWTMAGVEERSLAEAKTKEVLEIYHTLGLKALDIEQQEILKRYGFC